MELLELGHLELTYQRLEALDYGVDRQFYGTLAGSISGHRLGGGLGVTNLAVGRPDGVNVPTLRGILTTGDDAEIWVEIDGIATLRQADDARVVVASVRFRPATYAICG